MAEAKRDGNRIPTLLGVSSADLITPIPVAVDPITGELLTQLTTDISVDHITLESPTAGTYIGDVTIDNASLAVTNAGTFAVQIDTSGIEDAGETAGGKLDMIGSVRRDTPASSAGTTGDNATINTDENGNLWVSLGTKLDSTNDSIASVCTNAGTFAVQPGAALTGPGNPVIDSYTHASINLAAGANQVLVSSAASKQIWVYGIGFTVNVAGTVSFQDESDTAITGIMNIAATSGMAIPPSGNFSMPIWKLGTDKDLEVDIVTSELDGWIDYAIVSV